MEPEVEVMRHIMVAASKRGQRLFRNNVGTGWTGVRLLPPKPMSVLVTPGDVVLRKARPLHAGLCKGSSDLIGWERVTITPDMVGKTLAVMVGCETKSFTGTLREEQEGFRQTLSSAGGIAIVARSIRDYERGVDEFRARL